MFETYYDTKEALLVEHEIAALPFSIGLDENSKISYLSAGSVDWHKETQEIATALKSGKSIAR